MMQIRNTYLRHFGRWGFLLAALLWLSSSAAARDTDIYKVNVKQNCYILMDTSQSMGFGVYQHTIDYGQMFDYLFTLNETVSNPNTNPVTWTKTYIYDTVNNSSVFYKNHAPANKIYLWSGSIGVTTSMIEGKQISLTGDAADPAYLWSGSLIDTHTLLDAGGNLVPEPGYTPRITVDGSGHILLDGRVLPFNQDILAHDFTTFYNGTVVDNGFCGLLQSPGYYFSGYQNVTSLIPAVNGTTSIYFFVTGNWTNMQAMYNLSYVSGSHPVPAGATPGDFAWVYESFPLASTASWPQMGASYGYPAGGNYTANQNTQLTITIPGAQQMQLHFSAFDVKGDGSATAFTMDYVQIYDSSNNLVAQYDNDNTPISVGNTNGSGWSPVISGGTAIVKFHSSSTSPGGLGYHIDQTRSTTLADAYLMQSRYNVAKDALSYVVDAFKDKINWGMAYFNPVASNGGIALGSGLILVDPGKSISKNKSDINDLLVRAAPPPNQTFDTPVANDRTPLMESLQDVWIHGYYGQRDALGSQPCSKNYVITMSDGFASQDNDAGRIHRVLSSAPVFSDTDNDRYTQDPYQYKTNAPPDFYDDVAQWIYTHSWRDGSPISDPAGSYENVITHNIAFGSTQPLMQDASIDGGGQYLSVYNKEQLVSAFYSLGLMMSQAVSFTSPVVSVDTANKIQSGNDLYMGIFLPQANGMWTGNLKKFVLGDGSGARPNPNMIYDANNNPAIDGSGQFLPNNAPWWGKNTIIDTSVSSNLENGGAGQVLRAAVATYFANGIYWNRPIYTWKHGRMVHFDRDNITAADLGISTGAPALDNATRDRLINYVHGYTYDADGSGKPLAVRDWVLGAIIHSQPMVIDYFDTSSSLLPLQQRYVAVGSNDGMLHVFSDTVGTLAPILGQEVFAFIPPDIMRQLKNVQASPMYDTVDGTLTLYRWPASTANTGYNAAYAKNPKYLIFGERRGGGNFWSLDVTNRDPVEWTVKWTYSNPEISQSWSNVQMASIPISISSSGAKLYKDVAVFTGGYDALEDNYPEEYADNPVNPTGNPYSAYPFTQANIDPGKWDPAHGLGTDYNNNGKYDKYNPEIDNTGRGIFVVDIDNPATVTNVTPAGATVAQQILPFQVTYSATGMTANTSTGNPQTRADMRYCFPASPTLVTDADQTSTSGGSQYQRNVLEALYAIDIYANLFKVMYTFAATNSGTDSSPHYALESVGWTVDRVFSANPGSASASGTMGVGPDLHDDNGRKAFFPPAISWGGTAEYFQASNFKSTWLTFSNLNTLASLFFGTGDPEHPTYTSIRNRFYAVYDDSSVTAIQPLPAPPTAVQVSTAPYHENNLLNLTCDELEPSTVITGPPLNGSLFTTFTSSADMKHALTDLLTSRYGPNYANNAKGWYIVLPDQGDSAVCSHVSYPASLNNSTINAPDNHFGEQILSPVNLFADTLYFTSYQPSIGQPCNPMGNGFAYSIDYRNGTAVYNLNSTTVIDIADRYKKFTGISGIPSGFTIVIRNGQAAALASMGGAIIGPGGFPGDPFKINSPGSGLQIFYWRDSNSLLP
ncbi:MAG: hypothetical protein P4L42_13790 [Desulfocapsaceae bacterium]|nr:hypothetical protein [Desulfocapsaceae bacterium]